MLHIFVVFENFSGKEYEDKKVIAVTFVTPNQWIRFKRNRNYQA